MKTIIKKEIYCHFDELTEERKAEEVEKVKASEEVYNILNEDVKEELTYLCELKGVNLESLYYSLSYCQGDGVSFDVESIDFEKFLTKREQSDYARILQLLEQEEITLTIKQSNSIRYYHYNSMCIDLDFYYLDDEIIRGLESDFIEFEKLIASKIQELSKECEKEGYKFFDCAYNVEWLSEYLSANSFDDEYLLSSEEIEETKIKESKGE